MTDSPRGHSCDSFTFQVTAYTVRRVRGDAAHSPTHRPQAQLFSVTRRARRRRRVTNSFIASRLGSGTPEWLLVLRAEIQENSCLTTPIHVTYSCTGASCSAVQINNQAQGDDNIAMHRLFVRARTRIDGKLGKYRLSAEVSWTPARWTARHPTLSTFREGEGELSATRKRYR